MRELLWVMLRWLRIWALILLALCLVSMVMHWSVFISVLGNEVAAMFSGVATLIIAAAGIGMIVFSGFRR